MFPPEAPASSFPRVGTAVLGGGDELARVLPRGGRARMDAPRMAIVLESGAMRTHGPQGLQDAGGVTDLGRRAHRGQRFRSAARPL